MSRHIGLPDVGDDDYNGNVVFWQKVDPVDKLWKVKSKFLISTQFRYKFTMFFGSNTLNYTAPNFLNQSRYNFSNRLGK